MSEASPGNFREMQSRRKFISKTLVRPIFAAALVGACKTKKDDQSKATGPESCDDLNNVTAEEIKKRLGLAYVEQSPDPDSQCNNCQLYIPPKEGQPCGGCLLFKGPVFAKGYCTYWAPLV